MDQNKVTLCWPNRLDQAGLTGGSWLPALPLNNLLDRKLAKKARSTDLLTTSTRFEIALDSGRPVFVLALAGHNLSPSATVRVKFYQDYAKTTLLWDSGVQNAWPASYTFEQLEWEDNNFWFGNDTLDIASDFTALALFFADQVYSNVRQITVDITDSLNTAGYVQIGRAFISTAWQPEINMEFGVQFGYVNTTAVEEALDGTEYFDRKRQRRTMLFTLGALTADEAFSTYYAMQRDLGTDKEVLIAYELNAGPLFYYRTFLGRLAEVSPITQPYLDRFTSPVNVREIL